MIPEVANHLISSGGKRLRPMLTLATAGLAGYRGDGHVKLAASVEFMHTATLLHDDVVDESDMRRGKRRRPHQMGQRGKRARRRFPARAGLQDDGRGRLAPRPRDPLLRRDRDRRGRGDAARGRQEHRDDRGRIPRRHPRQDGGTLRRRLRGRPGDCRPAEGGGRRLPLLRHESRHRLPARRRCPRLRRHQREARKERRRRFPRRQDHAAGRVVLPARQRARTRPSGSGRWPRATSATATSRKRLR